MPKHTISALLPGLLLLLLLAVNGLAFAQNADSDRERILQALRAVNPELQVERIAPSPLDGLYQVLVSGQVVYVSADGRYLIQGDMLDLERQQSVSEGLRGGARVEKIAAHGTENMIIYPAQGEREHVVTVFTDIDCPYCRQLHASLSDFTSRGIEVRYIQMPRAGEGSESYRKAVSVWCSEDRKAAMTRAKSGAGMDARSCGNPVSSQLQLARGLGVNATPTFITETGIMHRGLMGAEQLKTMLDAEKGG